MTRELIGIRYSPWTQKARWPLEHHGLSYRYSEHLMMVGIPLLRLKSGNWTGEVTVPSMICDGQVLPNSLPLRNGQMHRARILRYFLRMSEAIAFWNTESDSILENGRLLLTRAMLGAPRSMTEVMPPLMGLLPGSMLVARQAAHYVLRRYNRPGNPEVWLGNLKQGLDGLREGLAGQDYLLGRFTFADLAMAAALQMVRPPENRYVKMGPVSRQCWTRLELVDAYSDLLGWRDRIFERHAPSSL